MTALDIVRALIFQQFKCVEVPADGVLPRAAFVGLCAGANCELDGPRRVTTGRRFGPVRRQISDDRVEVTGMARFEGFGDLAVMSGPSAPEELAVQRLAYRSTSARPAAGLPLAAVSMRSRNGV